MPTGPRELATSELIAELRRAAAIWFRNDHLMILEELIRRMPPDAPKNFLPENDPSDLPHKGEDGI